MNQLVAILPAPAGLSSARGLPIIGFVVRASQPGDTLEVEKPIAIDTLGRCDDLAVECQLQADTFSFKLDPQGGN